MKYRLGHLERPKIDVAPKNLALKLDPADCALKLQKISTNWHNLSHPDTANTMATYPLLFTKMLLFPMFCKAEKNNLHILLMRYPIGIPFILLNCHCRFWKSNLGSWNSNIPTVKTWCLSFKLHFLVVKLPYLPLQLAIQLIQNPISVSRTWQNSQFQHKKLDFAAANCNILLQTQGLLVKIQVLLFTPHFWFFFVPLFPWHRPTLPCPHAPTMAGCFCGSGPCCGRRPQRRAVERRTQRAAAELVARQRLWAATDGADRPYREGDERGWMGWAFWMVKLGKMDFLDWGNWHGLAKCHLLDDGFWGFGGFHGD